MTAIKIIQRLTITGISDIAWDAYPAARRWALKTVGVLAVASIPLVASAFEQASEGVYSDRIDSGLRMDMSGTASGSQTPWIQGAQAYAPKVNEAGGVNGRERLE